VTPILPAAERWRRAGLMAGFPAPGRSDFVPRGARSNEVPDEPTDLMDYVPSLKPVREAIPRLRRWAMAFDRLDGERYTAEDFVEWLELEVAEVKPLPDSMPTYPLVGAAKRHFSAQEQPRFAAGGGGFDG
jgi:hypothetical protein